MEMIKESLMTLLCAVICGAISILTAYVTAYMKKLSEKAKMQTEKIDNAMQRELVDSAIDRINELITTNVIKMQETTVKEIKEQAKDGKVNKEDLQNVAIQVRDNVLNQLSNDVKQLASVEINDLESYISAQIEVSLASIKKQI